MAKQRISRRAFVGTGLGLAAAATVVSLPKFGGSVFAQDATPEAAGDAMVRVVHASPDAPGVDILVNGERAIENLEFGAATDYVPLPAGDYQVQVVPTGAEAADAVIDAMLTLEGGKYYQVAAVGPVAEIAPAVFEVDASAVTEGMARVRVIHASPDAPAVDVTLADGTVIFGNLEFPNASEYAEVEGTTYDLQVRPAGTEDVALDLPGVALDAGTIYDIFAIGTLADGTLNVLPLTTMPMAAMEEGDSMAADSQIRVLHASPDAPAVDVYVNGSKAVENLGYGEATSFTSLPAGDYQVQVTPTGADVADSVIDATVTLEPGLAYTVAAVGLVADISAIVVDVQLAQVPDGKARIRAVHASPDAPAVDIAVTGGPVLIENLAFPSASDYIEVDAGTYDLEIRPTGTEDVALPIPGAVLESGMVYDVFAIGTIAEGTLSIVVLTADPAA